jgi:EF hand
MKLTSRLAQLGLSLMLAAAAASAIAADAPAQNPNPRLFDFKPIDANSDGRVSLEEAKPHSDLVSAFEMLDTNHDDFLTALEFSRWSLAGKSLVPTDPTTAPSGSNGAQHMPDIR